MQREQVSYAQVQWMWMFFVILFFSPFARCFIVHALPPRGLGAAVKWFCLECDGSVSGEIV